MLFFLFSTEELRALFERLGLRFDGAVIARDDRVLHAANERGLDAQPCRARLGARTIRSSASRGRCSARRSTSDVGDIQGGTTREGIHLGAMAGTVDLLQRAYLGLELRDDVLCLNPRLIDRLDGCRSRCSSAASRSGVSLEQGRLTVVALADGFSPSIRVSLGDQVRAARPRARAARSPLRPQRAGAK